MPIPWPARSATRCWRSADNAAYIKDRLNGFGAGNTFVPQDIDAFPRTKGTGKRAIEQSNYQITRLSNYQIQYSAASVPFPVSLLERIKLEANKRDVPYQSLIKVWLSEKVSKP